LRRLLEISAAAPLLLLAAALGCADPVHPTRTTTTTQTPTSSAPVTNTTTGTLATYQAAEGSFYGGRQPIAGSHIYLFAANTSAWGDPSIPLLKASASSVKIDADGTYITTNSSGNFNLTGLYQCTPGQQVYVYASGGNPGVANGAVNAAIGMLAILGTCPSDGTFAGHISGFIINEVTTVAATYALAGFMTDGTHVSSGPSANAQQGLANAFATVTNLVDLTTGTALPGNQDNGFSPQTKLNALANLLAPCVNSSGVGSACNTLFSNTRVSATAPPPANTVAATLFIAQHPAQNVAQLFGLTAAGSPYQPTIAAAPNDWTLAITFFSDQMAGPYYPAFDSLGNLWVPGYATNTLVRFTPTGIVSNFTSGGVNQPFAVAVDANDKPWVVNFAPIGASNVSVLNNDGTGVTSTGHACAATCFFPAFDSSGNLWISGTSRTTVLSSNGSKLAAIPTDAYTSGIALDSSDRAWTLGHGGNVYRFTLPAATSQLTEPVTATTGDDLTPVAIDSGRNIWFASRANSVLGKLDPNGALLSPATGFTGGGLSGPAGIAIDGADRVWVANRDGNSLSAFASDGTALSPTAGYKADNVSGPRGIAIDPSGNVWVANFTYNSVTEFVGAATPVSTPINPRNHGQRP
jgi:streptogramin lyase